MDNYYNLNGQDALDSCSLFSYDGNGNETELVMRIFFDQRHVA